METIIIDIEIVEPVFLELGLEGEMLVNPTPAPAFIKGERGEQGIQGERGEQGIQGERGEQGIQGERGEQGIQGERGEQGIQGERGEQGIQGERGEQGTTGVIILDSHIGGTVINNTRYAKLRDVLFPANTLNNGDVVQVSVLVLQNYTSVIKNAFIHLVPNTSTTLSDTNIIAQSVSGTTATIQHPIIREFILWNGSLQLLQPSTTSAANDPVAAGTVSTEELYPFNNTIDNYLTISAGSLANNTFTKELKRSLIKIIKKS